MGALAVSDEDRPPPAAALVADDGSAAERLAPSPRGAGAPQTRALLEVIDRDGHVRQVWTLRQWPARIGRALDNDVVLTDPHVAPHHFRLDHPADNMLVLETGDTVNGVTVATRRIAAGTRTELVADKDGFVDLVAGRTRLRLRLAESALAPEVPLATHAVRRLRVMPTLVLAALLLAGVAFATYLDSDPDNFGRGIGNTLLAGVTVAALWCGAWALLSKTITRQGHFGWHLRVFVIGALALLGLTAVPGLLAFALSWPWLTSYAFIATFAVGAAALYYHLLGVEPARPQRLRWVVAAGAVVGIALTMWFNQQRTGRFGDELYLTHLYPPGMRLVRPVPVDRFIDGLAPLHATLDQKAREPATSDAFGPDASDGNDDDN
ncbi:MAG TPA: FHA domain-containing protein [Caldimonas sp.]|nr:FHA domain-containing protein [Caldimonas sp.]